MKTFCQSCGGGVDYPSVRPNFCPYCGTSMSVGRPIVASRPQPQPQPSRRPTPSYQPPAFDYYQEPEEVVDGVDFSPRGLPQRPAPVLGEHVFATGSTGYTRRPKMKAKDFKEFAEKMHTEKPKPIELD
jgi:hypothetical protein